MHTCDFTVYTSSIRMSAHKFSSLSSVCVCVHCEHDYCVLLPRADIVIGFTQSSYTFPESDSGAFVTLAKDSGIVSERNDIAVSVSLSGPSSATQSVDFTVSLLDSRIDFDFEQQTFNIPISIINDELPEGTESFTLSVMSVDFGFASQRQDTFETTEVFIQDNDSMPHAHAHMHTHTRTHTHSHTHTLTHTHTDRQTDTVIINYSLHIVHTPFEFLYSSLQCYDKLIIYTLSPQMWW